MNAVKEEKKKAQSVLDFTFQKLNEALGHPETNPGRVESGSNHGSRQEPGEG